MTGPADFVQTVIFEFVEKYCIEIKNKLQNKTAQENDNRSNIFVPQPQQKRKQPVMVEQRVKKISMKKLDSFNEDVLQG